MARVAINGFGRIGRATFKILADHRDFDVVAINDLVPVENLAYLLQYDTVYGVYDKKVEAGDNALIVDNKEYRVLSEKDPANLPWKDMDVDLVFECTGLFARKEDMEKHLKAGAKRVILSAPEKSGEIRTVVHGVNSSEKGEKMISVASCTTNSLTPVFEIIGRRIGVRKAMMSTIHAYTSTQQLVDAPDKHIRRGRAAAANIVPTSTGAAVATTKVLQQYKGLFDGVALRVPIPVGSISDITFVTSRSTSVEEVNRILQEEAASERYTQILECTNAPLVSSDVVKNPHASIVDLEMTRVVDGDLVKIMAWYDNEWGFANQMVREAYSLTAS